MYLVHLAMVKETIFAADRPVSAKRPDRLGLVSTRHRSDMHPSTFRKLDRGRSNPSRRPRDQQAFVVQADLLEHRFRRRVSARDCGKL